ncbi:PREDICTED: cGMP-specific 3',5'-cyclic phosphodiesterase-like [Priapulus caudatus]|uniref:cGMP-specific 3',5'-cyclic phosphodiesterase-like n=1 Tax=Priapulus caudatus TaxID=37621 RepID=A0ABM1E6Y5_PRICU|nr:PREDICTED: cGMP-specific 3',5'-cyclic phosphodiesterase-like [Priapulus caudatus]
MSESKEPKEAALTEEAVSAYLLKNTKFCRQWFVKNGTKQIFDQWLTKGSDIGNDNRPSLVRSETDLSDKYVSHHSALLASSKFQELLLQRHQNVKQNKAKLKQLEEKELIMELIRDVASELDINILCHKILINVSLLTNSDRGSLFLAEGPKDNRVLVAKLFDVTTNSTVEEVIIPEGKAIRIPFGVGIAGHVAHTSETVNIKDAYEDPRFNQEIDMKTGYKTHSILCLPIRNYEGEVIGVAQIINKQIGTHEFTDHDEKIFRTYLTFCGIGIQNAQLFDMSVREYKRNRLLLQLAKGIFEEQTDLDVLIRKIMVESIGLLKCERCCVYLVDIATSKEQEVTFSKCFELLEDNPSELIRPSNVLRNKSYNGLIAKHVALKEEVRK